MAEAGKNCHPSTHQPENNKVKHTEKEGYQKTEKDGTFAITLTVPA